MDLICHYATFAYMYGSWLIWTAYKIHTLFRDLNESCESLLRTAMTHLNKFKNCRCTLLIIFLLTLCANSKQGATFFWLQRQFKGWIEKWNIEPCVRTLFQSHNHKFEHTFSIFFILSSDFLLLFKFHCSYFEAHPMWVILSNLSTLLNAN